MNSLKEKQYNREKEIAKLLLNSPKEKRRRLYSQEYDKFFKDFPNHSSNNLDGKINNTNQEILILHKLIKDRQHETFLEIGAGDSLFARKACDLFDKVIAIDVSGENNKIEFPKNYKQIICDGFDLPIEHDSVDFAFSNQVAEHLHPEDLKDQLISVIDKMKKGAIFELITPHKYKGPHDVSKYFSNIAEGLHLKEYKVSELKKVLKDVGFVQLKIVFKIRSLVLLLPIDFVIVIETILTLLPFRLRRFVMNKFGLKQLFFIRTLSTK